MKRSASLSVARRNSLSESSNLTRPISRRYKRTGSSESSIANSCERSGRISSISSSCCASRASSGSTVSSAIRSREIPLSSTNASKTGSAKKSGSSIFGICAEGSVFLSGLAVALVVGFTFAGIGFLFPDGNVSKNPESF